MKKSYKLFICFLLIPVFTLAQGIGTGLGYHSIAVKSDGTVYTWGYNGYGQLGNGNTTNSNVPVAVNTSDKLSGKTITQVAAGFNHSIALASDGLVYTWGRNNFGQLGDSTNSNSSVPVAVTTSGVLNGKTITQVASGNYHSIALASDGTVYTWGYNYYGQLGNGTSGSGTNSNVPVAVNTSGALSGKTITKVAAGDSHTIALASDGTVYTWGYNIFGQLGNESNISSNVPVAVTTNGVLSGKIITQVVAGYSHSMALASGGMISMWGDNSYGQLGNVSTGITSSVPVAVDQSGMGALPVELTSFSATSTSSATVVLNWQTATELNNYGFEIERSQKTEVSSRNSDWQRIGFVNGSGNSISPKSYSFTDDSPLSGTVQYRLKQIDYDGKYDFSKEVEITVTALPKAFALEQNYPNPFNPSTTIKYSLPSVTNVSLKIYDILGNEVANLVNEKKDAGEYEFNFNASNLASGIYFYKLQAGSFSQTKKLLLIK